MKERGRQRERERLTVFLAATMVVVRVLVRLRRRVLLLQSAERASFASNTAKELWDRMKDLVYTETSTRVSRGIIWDLFGFRFMLHSTTGLDNLTPDNSILLLRHSFYSYLSALFYVVALTDDQWITLFNLIFLEKKKKTLRLYIIMLLNSIEKPNYQHLQNCN